MTPSPPKFATKLLRRFSNIDFLEEIEGDLNEQFHERLQEKGVWKAKLLYVKDVMQALKLYPAGRRKVNSTQRLPLSDSLQHFLKITFRNLQRSKSTAFINITGLAISIASFFLIALYLYDESTYDSFHPDSKNVYRISHSYKRWGDGTVETDARAAGLWSVALKDITPQVKQFTRFSRFGYPGSIRNTTGEKVFVEQQFFWVDSTYTDIFSLPLLKGGDAKRMLINPQYVIINETVATKYFGNEEAIGQSLIYTRDGMDFSFIVGGIMKNYPSNAHFHPDFIASNVALNALWKQSGEDRVNSWGDAFTYSYVKVDDGTSPAKIEAGVRRVFDEHLGKNAPLVWPTITRLTDIHFTPGLLIELETPGEKSNLYIFGTIGLLILFIATINYMNLATARSVKRSKEVGLRKTLGVAKSSLIIQFLGESLLTTLISVVFAVLISTLLLPFFNELTGKSFGYAVIFTPVVLIAVCGITLIMGVVAGSYPAFYLSAFRPMEVLKGKLQTGAKAEAFRKMLVVIQFTITLMLIVGSVVIDRQLFFMNHTKLTEYKDQILTVRLYGIADLNKLQNLIITAKQQPQVDDITFGTQLPRRESFGWIDTKVKAQGLSEDEHIWEQLDVAYNFPNLFGLQLINGRSFGNSDADSSSVLVNESALKDLNITDDKALGLVLTDIGSKAKKTVIGVVKDFNYSSARKAVRPLIITGKSPNAETLYVKLKGQDYAASINSLHRIWKQLYPATPFEYWFMDDEYGRLYQSERQTATIVKCFAILTIFVGCLGLFGLSAFTAEQKRKEIGIRKILGATNSRILLLLSSRFITLIAISFLIGMPLAYYIASRWLESFAYKIDIAVWFFALPAVLILILTCVTVGIESFRAARANPVDMMRHE